MGCSSGRKGGALVGETKIGKGTKLVVLADGACPPLGIYLEAASPSEVTLLDPRLNKVCVKVGRGRGKPKRLIDDRGYESNAVRLLLVKRGIEPIIPARVTNSAAPHQDGRKLRRYKRRWIIERSHS